MKPATVPERVILIGDGTSRLDHLLLERLRIAVPEISRSILRTAWKAGIVRADSGRGPRSLALSDVPSQGLELAWTIDAPGLLALATPRASLHYTGAEMPVIFENESIIVFNKPSGTPSVPHAPGESDTAVNRFLSLHPECADLLGGPLEPGLLHRLDTETSGCLAFAKTNTEWRRIRSLWKTDQVRKIYLARITGATVELESLAHRLPFEITTRLGHSSKSSRRMIPVDPHWSISECRRRLRGAPLPARTRLLRAGGGSPAEGWLDLEIEIFTGVLHQIRAHLRHLGHPITGDRIYGGAEAPRLCLHAWRLTLPDPDGQPLEITAPPENFLKKTLPDPDTKA